MSRFQAGDRRINRRSLLRGLSLGALAVAATPTTSFAKVFADGPKPGRDRPNLIVIMGDDIGYSDIGAFGGEVDTPNLNALAARSVRFSNFYNMSRCCPSRASLLTGRYPHRVNMTGNGTSLSRDVPTVAEELRRAGYATSMVGKWHLTAAEPIPDPAEHLKWLNHQAHLDRDFGDKATYPAARGFQYHWGIIWGVADYYDPFSLVENFTPVQSVPQGFYLTDAISDHAVEQVGKLSKGADPFMMYVAYTAAHWPLMAPEAKIAKYLKRYEGGWEKLRADRYARQVKMGLIDPKTYPLPPLSDDYANNSKTAWDSLTPEQRTLQVRKMATHAAMIDVMDEGIGRIVQALKDNGTYDNTVVMFLIDNGASPEIMVKPGYDRPSQTRDGREVQYGEYPDTVGTELNETGIGAHWASAANTPWRYWKAESYQGGTHTPFMMSWPARLKSGRTVADPAHVVDITPTLLALAGASASPSRAPMDGKSIAGALTGGALPSARPFFFEHYGARAVIDGRWKLVSLAPKGPGAYLPWALFDLQADRTEMDDLAAKQPDTVRRLEGEWTAWAASVGLAARRGAAG